MQININDIPVNYLAEGSGDAVLILPGWGATSAVYTTLSKQLSEKFTVYTLDLPGFGITPEPPQPWSVDDYADFVTAFIHALGLSSVLLAGHSFGGRIILNLCTRQTDFEIPKILLIDAAGIKNPLSPEKQKRQDRFKKMKKFCTAKPVAALFPHALDTLQKKYGSADYAAASPIMRQTLVKAVSEDYRDRLCKVQAEAFLIWGRDDTATPLSDALTMQAEIPHTRLEVIEQAGHFSFLDQPFAFRKILKAYFDLT